MKILLSFVAILVLFNQIDCFPTNNKTCQACTKFTDFLWKITNNADEKLYESLTTYCNEYSVVFETNPNAVIQNLCNQSIHGLFTFINQRLDKDKFCLDIKACKDDSDNGIRYLTGLTGNDPADCQLCEYVFTKIKELVTGSPTEIDVKTHFENVCHYMRSFKNECVSMVDENIDAMFDYIKDHFDPNEACKSMRVCTMRTGPLIGEYENLPSAAEMINLMPVNFSLTNTDTEECAICKKLVKIIQASLKNNATEEQIIEILQEVCEIAPSKDRVACKNIITNYAQNLIQILTQLVDPETACTLAGLCTNQNFNDYLNGNLLHRYTSKSNALCVECELISHFIQNSLYNYKNEEQIEEFIKHQLCTKMSYILNVSNCQAFIDQYGPIIMQTIAQDLFNPDLLCFKELKLCKKTKIRVITDTKVNMKCKICHSIVETMEKANRIDLQTNAFIDKACEGWNSFGKECRKMAESFGPHFLDMIGRFDDNKKICESVDICLNSGKVHLLGGEKCTYGPSYWCHTLSHANACNAYKFCNEKIWKSHQNQI